jgi:uncharacterized protein with von Willebrand factor type A (vWA) domain
VISRKTSITENIVEFCRFFRGQKYSAGVHEEITALRALSFFNFENSHDFRLLLRAVLCKSHSELQRFDELFDAYWKEAEKGVDSKIKRHPNPPGKQETLSSLKVWKRDGQSDDIEETATYSTAETLLHKDFSAITADEVDDLSAIIKALSIRLATRTGRRYERSNRVDLPDLRRTLRLNMRRGGELIEIFFRKPKKTRIRVVIVCDVSKSMDLYSSFLLQFMYAFQQVYSRIETFAFGTSLQCITSVFKQHDFDSAFHKLSYHSDTWSGGTRIGESLDTFIAEYGSKLLSKKTIIIILSDGWDTGEGQLLQDSMRHLKEHSKKIIWLNPLAGYHLYRPETSGMRIALPFVDVFATVHNAESLKSLHKWL